MKVYPSEAAEPRFRVHLRRAPGWMVALAVPLTVELPRVLAQEGGVLAEFCRDQPACSEDALEIVFDSGTSTHQGPLGIGAEIAVRVVLDTKSLEIQGYSWAVKHDPEVLSISPDRVTSKDTIIDPTSPETALGDSPFVITRVVPGGFFGAVVLSMTAKAEMPLGRNVVCRAAYVVRAAPVCTVIRFVHLQLGNEQLASPRVSVNVTAGGLSKQPRFLRQGLIGNGMCAETCDDLADNDGDGLADCKDPECASTCGIEACEDGIDNEGDSFIDCDDSECWTLPRCSTEVCSDGEDNDRDSLVDCDDLDCAGQEPCPELETCNDDLDNDEDGLVDCEDSDCNWSTPCREICADGLDNDGNDFIDELDADCFGGTWIFCGLGPLPPSYIRGDADGNGRIEVLDARTVLQVCLGEEPPYSCMEALNANADQGIDPSDALPLLHWLFLQGPALPAPFPECGVGFYGCAAPSPGC